MIYVIVFLIILCLLLMLTVKRLLHSIRLQETEIKLLHGVIGRK